MITLYYNFNDLWSFEYNVDELDILKAVYQITGRTFDIKIMDTVFNRYQLEIKNKFKKDAYNLYKMTDDFKYGIVVTEIEEIEYEQIGLNLNENKKLVELHRKTNRRAKTQEKIAKMKELRSKQLKLNI